jgi:hypothetical protein
MVPGPVSSLLLRAAHLRRLAAYCGDARAMADLTRYSEELEADAAKIILKSTQRKPKLENH